MVVCREVHRQQHRSGQSGFGRTNFWHIIAAHLNYNWADDDTVLLLDNCENCYIPFGEFISLSRQLLIGVWLEFQPQVSNHQRLTQWYFCTTETSNYTFYYMYRFKGKYVEVLKSFKHLTMTGICRFLFFPKVEFPCDSRLHVAGSTCGRGP